MILSYSDNRFPALIEQGIKIHTFREDVHDRWKPGNSIQHWMHNPRVVSKNPYQFCKGMNDICKGVQKVTLIYSPVFYRFPEGWVNIIIDGMDITGDAHADVFRNDGFKTMQEFIAWFFPEKVDDVAIRRLKLIHWTDKTYGRR